MMVGGRMCIRPISARCRASSGVTHTWLLISRRSTATVASRGAHTRKKWVENRLGDTSGVTQWAK